MIGNTRSGELGSGVEQVEHTFVCGVILGVINAQSSFLQQTYLIVVRCLVHVDDGLHCRGGVGMLSLRSREAALGVGMLPSPPSDPPLVSTDDAAPITISCYE